MAGRLVSITSHSPGVSGLDLQREFSARGVGWATKALNCVLDESGRLSSRNGWEKQNSTALTGSPDIVQLYEYINSGASTDQVFSSSTALWHNMSSPSNISGSVSISAGNWKFQNFKGSVVGAQQGHEPVIYSGSGNFTYLVDEHTTWTASASRSVDDTIVPTVHNGYYYQCTTAGMSSASEPTWDTTPNTGTTSDGTAVWTTREIPKSNELLSAWGRLWVVDPNTPSVLHYSDLLIPEVFHGGSAGSIDLQAVWTNGQDEIVALAAFNSSLIILGKDSIVVYSNADDVLNISLQEVVYGTGCIARDSVRQIDEDLLYLAKDGIRSLKRDLVRQKMPLSTVTENIRDDIVQAIASEDVDKVRSAYYKNGSFYCVLFPTSMEIYVLDVRRYLTNGQVSVFKWDDLGGAKSLASFENGSLMLGMPGYVGKYSGYTDNGSPYTMRFKSAWIDPHKEWGDMSLSGRTLILKRLEGITGSTLNLQPSLEWFLDYANSPHDSRVIQLIGDGSSEYGLAEYGVDDYAGGDTRHRFNVNTTGHGQVFAFGMNVVISGAKIYLASINNYFTIGRTG